MLDRKHPPLVEITSTIPMTEAIRQKVLDLTYRSGLVNHFNNARTELRKTDKGYPIHETATAFLLDPEPREGIAEEHSKITLPDGSTACLAVRLESGVEVGIFEFAEVRWAKTRFHVFPGEAHSWVVSADAKDPPRMIKNGIAAIHMHDHFSGENAHRLKKPFTVSGQLTSERLAIDSVLDFNTPEAQARQAEVDEAQAAYDARLEIAQRHITPEVMLDLINMAPAGDYMPEHHAKNRRDYDDKFEQILYNMLLDLKEAGMVAPCYNNGARKIYQLDAWDAWTKLDNPPKKVSDLGWDMQRVTWAPMFRLAQSTLIRTGIDIYPDRKEASQLPETDETRALDRVASIAIAQQIARRIAMDHVDLGDSIDLQSQLNGDRLHLVSSMLKPRVMKRNNDYRGFTHLEPIEVPKMLRHLTLPLPSGRMFVADWPRIPGFTEVVEERCGDHFEINYQDGLIAEQKSYYENLGFLKIQVGNTSPKAFEVSPGVWRAGRIDEDSCYDDDGNYVPPVESWGTCTDLWANTYIDYDQLTDVLMVSGKYADVSAAQAAIDNYVSNTYGAQIVEVGHDHLEFYVPNGKNYLKEDFVNDLGLSDHGFDEDQSWNTHYFLSNEELPIDKELLADGPEWVPAGRLNIEYLRDDGPGF